MKRLLLILVLQFLRMNTYSQELSPELYKYCSDLTQRFSEIPDDRKETLLKIRDYIKAKQEKGEKIELTFICTHNSRRSQFGQVWAKIAAKYYGTASVRTYSGGTEVTACNERTVEAMRRAGVRIERIDEISAPVTVASNPRYQVGWGKKLSSMYLYSKKYDDKNENPQQNFCAILVCSSADEACPFVSGAEARIYHPYDDPKASDGKPEETVSYDYTCRLIALEMLFVFSQL